MKKLKGKTLAVLVAILLVIMASIGVTYAYFSDYEPAAGEATLGLSGQTTVEEDVDGLKKTIGIKNTGETNVVVRAAVFGPEGIKVSESKLWEKHGDFYYYKKVLAPGESTEKFTAELVLGGTDEEIAARKAELGDNFNITVVHESAVPVYDKKDTVVAPSGWGYFPAGVMAPALGQ